MKYDVEWVNYVMNNPDWREIHNKFINAQVINANKKLKELSADKLIELFNIKNKAILKFKAGIKG